MSDISQVQLGPRGEVLTEDTMVVAEGVPDCGILTARSFTFSFRRHDSTIW